LAQFMRLYAQTRSHRLEILILSQWENILGLTLKKSIVFLNYYLARLAAKPLPRGYNQTIVTRTKQMRVYTVSKINVNDLAGYFKASSGFVQLYKGDTLLFDPLGRKKLTVTENAFLTPDTETVVRFLEAKEEILTDQGAIVDKAVSIVDDASTEPPKDPHTKIRRETAAAIAASLIQHRDHYVPMYSKEWKTESLVKDAIAFTDELLRQLGQ